MERCNPHAWRTPAPGDRALVCDVCEAWLDLARDITPEVQADILRDYRRHHGPIVGEHFRAALEAALAAARSAGSSHGPASAGEGGA